MIVLQVLVVVIVIMLVVMHVVLVIIMVIVVDMLVDRHGLVREARLSIEVVILVILEVCTFLPRRFRTR